ncbi:MAG: hypothetical protein ABIM88_01925 [candidate division WOR-3 bacterium]
MRYIVFLLIPGIAMAQESVGAWEEEVVGVGETGTYNLTGNLSLWGIGTSVDTTIEPLYMHRVELAFDMTFGSWLSGVVRLQSWGAEDAYNRFNIPEAYAEAYLSDWFSLRAGKQLLIYGNGLVWSDRLKGYPALSLLFGDKVYLNIHALYTEPVAIGETPSWMAGANGGAWFGPLGFSLYALSRPTPSANDKYDLWAGGRGELKWGILSLALEGADYISDTISVVSGLGIAELARGSFGLGAALFTIDPKWVNPFGQNIAYSYDEIGWGGIGEAFTFGLAPDPFLRGLSDISAVNAHASYGRYLEFLRPDLNMMTRVDYYRLASAFTADSSRGIGNEFDISFVFEVKDAVKFGLSGGYLMAEEGYEDAVSVRAWLAKEFVFE